MTTQDDPLGRQIRERCRLLEDAGDTGSELYLLLVAAGSAHTALCARSFWSMQYREHMQQCSRALERLRTLWGVAL